VKHLCKHVGLCIIILLVFGTVWQRKYLPCYITDCAYGVQKGKYLSDTSVVDKRAEMLLAAAEEVGIKVNAEKCS